MSALHPGVLIFLFTLKILDFVQTCFCITIFIFKNYNYRHFYHSRGIQPLTFLCFCWQQPVRGIIQRTFPAAPGAVSRTCKEPKTPDSLYPAPRTALNSWLPGARIESPILLPWVRPSVGPVYTLGPAPLSFLCSASVAFLLIRCCCMFVCPFLSFSGSSFLVGHPRGTRPRTAGTHTCGHERYLNIEVLPCHLGNSHCPGALSAHLPPWPFP